jgi:acyl dehydratase
MSRGSPQDGAAGDGVVMRAFGSLAELAASVGESWGTSRWFEVSQARIDAFADVTEDHQWIHVDPHRAAGGPFGGTVAHGYLTLSMAAPMLADVLHVENLSRGVNYGLNRVRFPGSVHAGSSIRGVFTLTGATPVEGGLQADVEMVVEVEGQPRPGCVAELVIRLYPAVA